MRAAVAEGGRITVREIAEPVPGPGQALLSVLACGICGSDLHHFAGRAADAPPLVYGHEFAAEVVAYGPGADGPPPGTRVCAIPTAGGAVYGLGGIVGLSENLPGGFGERVVVDAGVLVAIPDHVPTEHAALTEPLAVGAHAAAAGRPAHGDTALIIGCGPIGLAVLAALKANHPAVRVVATDLSPARRALATRMGADEVVGPGEADPYAVLAEAEPASAGEEAPVVIYECVGVPGMLQKIIEQAPARSRVVVAGVCQEPDTILPVHAILKELRLAFVFGYTFEEFTATLGAIAAGAVDPAPMITANVGLENVEQAFADLGDPELHVKILVHPGGGAR